MCKSVLSALVIEVCTVYFVGASSDFCKFVVCFLTLHLQYVYKEFFKILKVLIDCLKTSYILWMGNKLDFYKPQESHLTTKIIRVIMLGGVVGIYILLY